jgi:hypothetical protein
MPPEAHALENVRPLVEKLPGLSAKVRQIEKPGWMDFGLRKF